MTINSWSTFLHHCGFFKFSNLIIIFYFIYQKKLNFNSSDSKNLQIKRYHNLISTCHINECRQKLLARRRTLKQRKKRSKTKTNNICHNHNRSLCQRTTTTYLLIPWRMFKVRRSVFASLYDIIALIGFSSDLSNAQKFDTWPA